MATQHYTLLTEDGYFYVEGPELKMASLDRFIQPPPVGVSEPESFSRRSAQRIVDMLNIAYEAGRKNAMASFTTVD